MQQYWAGQYSSFTKTARTHTILIIFHESDVIFNDKLSYYVVLFLICRFTCMFQRYSKNTNTVFIPIFGSLFSYFRQHENGSENVLINANRQTKMFKQFHALTFLRSILKSTLIINFSLLILVILLTVFKVYNYLFLVILKFQAGQYKLWNHRIFHKNHTSIVLLLWFS